MRRALWLIGAVAVLGAAGCGSYDSCTTDPARLKNTAPGTTCALAPASNATITVQLCAQCTDSNAACIAEFVNGHFEVQPTVQQCAADIGCAPTTACALQAPQASCTLTLPASAVDGNSYALWVIGSDTSGNTVTVQGTLAVQSGAGTSCTL